MYATFSVCLIQTKAFSLPLVLSKCPPLKSKSTKQVKFTPRRSSQIQGFRKSKYKNKKPALIPYRHDHHQPSLHVCLSFNQMIQTVQTMSASSFISPVDASLWSD
ncbi:hypothetical protein ILYODFUR_025707 [Ilyodon furcidens]|uniref:Uncharacterized protein n=1 Tax=Ilyodon furcidens TaxID=33524 RepID=A0ABV0VJK8_9TELE